VTLTTGGFDSRPRSRFFADEGNPDQLDTVSRNHPQRGYSIQIRRKVSSYNFHSLVMIRRTASLLYSTDRDRGTYLEWLADGSTLSICAPSGTKRVRASKHVECCLSATEYESASLAAGQLVLGTIEDRPGFWD